MRVSSPGCGRPEKRVDFGVDRGIRGLTPIDYSIRSLIRSGYFALSNKDSDIPFRLSVEPNKFI